MRRRYWLSKTPLIPGTRVSLIPPDGFTRSPRFHDYHLETSAATIMITEFPAPFTESISGFANSSGLAQRGMSVLSRRAVKVGQHEGELINIAQLSLGTEYREVAPDIRRRKGISNYCGQLSQSNLKKNSRKVNQVVHNTVRGLIF